MSVRRDRKTQTPDGYDRAVVLRVERGMSEGGTEDSVD